jgi:flagellar hook-associated protein 2
LANDQANITQLQNQKSSADAQTKALSQITSDLIALQSANFSLKDPLGSLSAQNATSSNTAVLTASASSVAVSAVHTITVNNLATTSSFYTNALASATTPLTTGSFQIQVGSAAPVTVTVDSTNNTLSGVATAINNLNGGIRASVITDANGARLALSSETTGAPGDLTVSANSTNLVFNKAVTGTNASLTVDGVPISSTSNTVSSVINGVTLNLNSASTGTPTTLTVAPDTTQATSALNQFVSAYNTAIKDVNAQFAVASDGSGGGPLEADGSLREAQAALLAAVTFSNTGNNSISNLESLGISLNNDGTLSVNQGTLTTNLSGNYSAVQNFLQSATNGFAANLDNVITNLTDPGSGTLGLDAKSIAQTSTDLSSQISDLQSALATKQASLILVYSQVNTTLEELPLLQAQLSQQLGSA